MNKEKLIEKIENIFLESNLIKAIFSNPISKNEYKKIVVKRILIKNEEMFQFESFTDKQAFHMNLKLEESKEKFIETIDVFKQVLIITEGKDIQILNKNSNFNIKEIKNDKSVNITSHNKEKSYLLKDGDKVDFLIKLGIMNSNGNVVKSNYKKFRQVNNYLEFINNLIEDMEKQKLIKEKITIVDFGCGKSYLTFAVYHYFNNIKKIDFEIVGLDLKKDVIKNCELIAKELAYDKISFLSEDIKNFKKYSNVDIVISLHACDLATDYSLLKALELNASAVMAVPCCHHEFREKMLKNKESEFFKNCNSIGQHGILLEKFAPIATDAVRSNLLELCGYKSRVMEFIDIENTPKNILIRAVKSNKKINKEKKYEEYKKLKEFIGIEPILEKLVEKYIK